MGQVVNFAEFKARRNSGVYAEIRRLENEICKWDGRLLYGQTVAIREEAAIKSMELKMQIVDLRNRMGITG